MVSTTPRNIPQNNTNITERTGEPTMVSATPRNTPQNNTRITTHRPTNNAFYNTKKHSTKQYQHNNTQANQQWFLQHQETHHKAIPTQQHTGEPTMVSAILRNTPHFWECDDLIFSIFIAFSSQPQEMDPTRHYFLVRSCPGFMPISFVSDSQKEKEKAPVMRDGIQGESSRLIEVWPCVFMHLSQKFYKFWLWF